MRIADLTRTVRTKITECGCGCWVWTGAKPDHGYATVKIKSKTTLVHRYVFEKDNPGVSLGYDDTIDHLCDRHRNCVNPAHMEVVTRSENSTRANARRWHSEFRTEPDGPCTVE